LFLLVFAGNLVVATLAWFLVGLFLNSSPPGLAGPAAHETCSERVRRISVLMGGDDRQAGRVVTGVFM
jgi:hypothetical protein